MPCSWLPPSFKSVPFAPISVINFADPENRFKASSSTPSSNYPVVNGTQCTPSTSLANLTPSTSELDGFFKQIVGNKQSLVAEYSDAYVPLYKKGTPPKPLTDYCEEKSIS